MSNNNKIVKIFTLPQRFPCGTEASCCGPIGQTDEEIESLKSTIKNNLNLETEVVNVEIDDMRDYSAVLSLLHSFGAMALPIITLDDEVVSIGNALPEEAISAIKEKMKS